MAKRNIEGIFLIFYLISLSMEIMKEDNKLVQEFRGVWVSP